MPLNETVFSNLIAHNLLINFKKKLPEAKKTPFQQELSGALSGGFLFALTQQVTVVGVGSGPVAGTGTGILGINPNRASDLASARFAQIAGFSPKGVFKELCHAVFLATEQHLSQATIMSVSGFGGQPTKMLNLNEDIVYMQVINKLSEQTQSNLLKSKYGTAVIKSLTHAFVAEMNFVTFMPIPFLPPSVPPGPLIAKIS